MGLLCLLWPSVAVGAGGETGQDGHSDPFVEILFGLAILVMAALFGRVLAARLDQPTVLGELLVGVVLGNIGYALREPLTVLIMHLDWVSKMFRIIWAENISVSDAARRVLSADQLSSGSGGERLLEVVIGPHGSIFVIVAFAIWIFSNLGVILLLFMVGLESSIDEMVRVGSRALSVALVGIFAPFTLGYYCSAWLLPDQTQAVHLFLAATLTATSVGITARVFKDFHRLHTPEAQIILGAAVIDDILGLIILAVVVGIVSTGDFQLAQVMRIVVLSAVFLGTVFLFGKRISKWTARAVDLLQRPHGKLLLPLLLAFFMSWVANKIELAAIVGAFAAGLILNEEHFKDRQHPIEEMVDPLEAIFAPIFFVLMGMQVNLATFLQPGTLGLASAFVVVAVVGKVVSGLPAGKELDRLTVGLGMMPRGEVGLIFASIGKGLGVVTDGIFSAVVIMVIVTTLVTPVALKWSLSRDRRAAAGGSEAR